MVKHLKLARYIIAFGFLLLFFGLGTQYAQAANDAYGDGNYGACTYDACPITISSTGTVAVNVLPTASTKCTTQSDAVGVTTDSSTGYTLSLNDSTTNSDLVGTSASISAISGSQSSPAALTANTWGYRVDSVGGFGAGPTSASSNTATSSTTFAPVPTSIQTPDTLVSSGSPADPTVTTTVWYGACANTSIPAGTYTDSVVYTAVIN
jgi:hypothetical protein